MPEGYSVKVRPEKTQAVEEIKERLGRSGVVVLTEYRGLSVTELATLRTELRKADVEYKVVKNTLALRATTESGIAGLDELFEGPTAVAFCYGDPVAAAKALTEFAKDHAALVIKGGVLDGKPMTSADAEGLAKVDPLEVSLAKIAGSLTSPLQAIVGVLEGAISRIISVLEQGAAAGEGGPFGAAATDGSTTESEAPPAEPQVAEAAAQATATDDGPDEQPPATDDGGSATEATSADAAGEDRGGEDSTGQPSEEQPVASASDGGQEEEEEGA